MPDGDAKAIRKGRKFDAVLDAARGLFLEHGFEATSVDEIARLAGVSKATLYSYFPDKSLLFLEVAKVELLRQADLILTGDNLDLPVREFLSGFGYGMLDFLTSRFGLSLFRVCVAESARFPDLGRQFMESGPMMVEDCLIRFIDAAAERGELVCDDGRLAAAQFAELCKAGVHSRILMGTLDELTPEVRARVIDGAVETFLARYGAPEA